MYYNWEYKLKIEICNFSNLFNPSNVITNFEGIDSKTKKFREDGIYSEKIFGRMYGQNNEYSCNCRKIQAKYNEGVLCTQCGTHVIKRESKLNELAWVDLNDYKIINPQMFPFLQKLIGKARINKYLASEFVINLAGNIVEPEIPNATKSEPHPELIGKGVIHFVNNIHEIIEMFKSDDNLETYNFIMENIECVTISKIPIISHRLRPAIMIKDDLIFDRVNTFYTQILKCNSTLNALSKDRVLMSEEALVSRIQSLAGQVYNYFTNIISGKTGFIRNSLLGNRLNFSSRCVIIPLAVNHDADEVHLPYLAALELYRPQITNYLVRLMKISYTKANFIWEDATRKYSKLVYGILNQILVDMKQMRILLNRNPTINLGSILLCRVTAIKDDINDLTLSLSNSILSFLSADFDGDVLNIFALFDENHIEFFKCLNPKLLSISSDDGLINNCVVPDKDYMLGLHVLVGAGRG
jgi:DNA-directed RNA polymerase beta' subunit